MKKRIYQAVSVACLGMILFGVSNQNSKQLHTNNYETNTQIRQEENLKNIKASIEEPEYLISTSAYNTLQMFNTEKSSSLTNYNEDVDLDENDEESNNNSDLLLFTKSKITVYADKDCTTEIDYIDYNETVTVKQLCSTEIIKIEYNESIYYAYLNDFIDDKDTGVTFSIPFNPNYNGKKTYMDYDTIKSYVSNQYKLQTLAQTDKNGLRVVNNRYCIAIGTYFNAPVGQYVDIVLSNGTVIPCIIGDIKANIHTDVNNIFTTASNCCTEFIVETSYLPKEIKTNGDISYISNEWNSPVTQIVVYDYNVLE